MTYWAPLQDPESAARFAAQGAVAGAKRPEVLPPSPKVAPEMQETMRAAAALRERLETLAPLSAEPGRWNFLARWRRRNAERAAKLSGTQWNFLNHYDDGRAAELSFTEARIVRALMSYAGNDQVEALLKRRAQQRKGHQLPTYHAQLERTLPTMIFVNIVYFQSLFPANMPELKILAMGCALLTHWGAAVLNRRASLHRVKLAQERLPGSDLVEQVVEGGTELEIIREYTPVMLRWLVLGAPGTRLGDRLGLLVNNLDWFVVPPAHWFRWQWFCLPAYVLGYILALTATFTSFGSHSSVLLNPWTAALAGTLVGFGSVAQTHAAPSRLFAALLLDKLDQRIEARLADEAATAATAATESDSRVRAAPARAAE